MKLKKVKIHKYKSFSSDQEFDLEDDITVLVGMNESGKTTILEAIAKTNYFQEDEKFRFNATLDYPRAELKKMERRPGKSPAAITCTYEIDEYILNKIKEKLGEGVFEDTSFSITTRYDNKRTIEIGSADMQRFIKNKIPQSNASFEKKLLNIKNAEELGNLKNEHPEDKYINAIDLIKDYFENTNNWDDPIGEYIYRKFLSPNHPKFLYYDEYYALPAQINIEKMQGGSLEEFEKKTAQALFDLSNINVEKIIQSDDFEKLVAELEATSMSISEEMFRYWKANQNLEIVFQIDTKSAPGEHILNVRVKNKQVSLPLNNRSKGFNWFFSFLIWFTKIQEDENSDYILLLDEPGLNLHASAQGDLLKFLEDLKKKHQILYTTHSPFMISPDKLNRERTVRETDEGAMICESIQQEDNKTLFPLQAALGYDIAQNLFISKNNLLVEGVADLIVLTEMSALLEKEKRIFLDEDITIVPVGGADKVATFIALLGASKSDLNIVCLLDSHRSPKIDDLIKGKIIKESQIRFYDQYVDGYNKADLEDLFIKSDYLKLFNSAFSGEYQEIKEDDLNVNIQSILVQINQFINRDKFSHYRPARELTRTVGKKVGKKTLDNFEKVFKDINDIFSKLRNK